MIDDIEFLSFDDIIRLHSIVIKIYGGSPGIRSTHLLESALSQPQLLLFGEHAHKSLYEMAAAYLFHIIKNHAFIDGNKRTGLLASLTFLERNNIVIKSSFDALFQCTVDTAESKLSKNDIAAFFSRHSLEK